MASPHPPFAGDVAFDPDTLQIMTNAFEDAWESLQTTGVRFENGQADAVRDMLAKCIVEMAKLGERDRRRLRDASLAHVAKRWGAPESTSD